MSGNVRKEVREKVSNRDPPAYKNIKVKRKQYFDKLTYTSTDTHTDTHTHTHTRYL